MHTLYGRIVWLYLLLLLTFCLLAAVFTVRQFDVFMEELEQRLNRDLARNLVDDLPQVTGDIGLIERALSNLVDNAIKSTPSGGRVEMAARDTEEGVRVSVSDTGHGIASDELPLVTQRFYRTQRNRSSQGNGTGLGLAIVSEIVELHGGSLHLESRLGAGTTAAFTLSAVR
ncbi:MAG: sensor histidine kinase [Nitrococcus sp.]|nr:sensor histidine kinase [Nitrococcus sp.]